MDVIEPIFRMGKGLLPYACGAVVLRCVLEFVKRLKKRLVVALLFALVTVSHGEFEAPDKANLGSVADDLSGFMRGATPLYSIAFDSDRDATLLGEAVAQTESVQISAHGVFILIGVLLALPMQMAMLKKTI